MDKSSVIPIIQKLIQSQNLAVLATSDGGFPYSSLVSFSSTDDLCTIVFATARQTRKYHNIQQNHRVSLLIDNRSNQESDLHQAVAVTALGRAREITSQEKGPFLLHHLIKHPALVDFTDSPDCALVLVEIDVYYVVQQFQAVTEFRPQP